jgi:hypothetical protein
VFEEKEALDYASSEIFLSLGTLKDTIHVSQKIHGPSIVAKRPECVQLYTSSTLLERKETVTKDCRRNIRSKLNL